MTRILGLRGPPPEHARPHPEGPWNPGGDGCEPGGVTCEPGGVTCEPGGVTCEPGGITCEPGGDGCEPGGVGYEPGGDGCEPGGDGEVTPTSLEVTLMSPEGRVWCRTTLGRPTLKSKVDVAHLGRALATHKVSGTGHRLPAAPDIHRGTTRFSLGYWAVLFVRAASHPTRRVRLPARPIPREAPWPSGRLMPWAPWI